MPLHELAAAGLSSLNAKPCPRMYLMHVLAKPSTGYNPEHVAQAQQTPRFFFPSCILFRNRGTKSSHQSRTTSAAAMSCIDAADWNGVFKILDPIHLKYRTARDDMNNLTTAGLGALTLQQEPIPKGFSLYWRRCMSLGLCTVSRIIEAEMHLISRPHH